MNEILVCPICLGKSERDPYYGLSYCAECDGFGTREAYEQMQQWKEEAQAAGPEPDGVGDATEFLTYP